MSDNERRAEQAPAKVIYPSVERLNLPFAGRSTRKRERCLDRLYCRFAKELSRQASDADDSNVSSGCCDQPLYVFRVACENHCIFANGCRDNNRVHHIRSSALSEQSPSFVCLGFIKRNNGATDQEAP